MNILHVYSHNLEVFNEVVTGTECHINGSDSIERLEKSLTRYNARDVMGLVVYPGAKMTKKCLKLVKEFDSLFEFRHLPIVLVCDDAIELVNAGVVKVKNSRLFAVDSMDGTISDVDLNRILATVVICSGPVYDLDVFRNAIHHTEKESQDYSVEPSAELLTFLKEIREYGEK